MMKIINETKFDIIEASHYGMCFGVKAAIATANKLASSFPVTILGELAHNNTVKKNLENKGAHHSTIDSESASTKNVIITAHGTSNKNRKRWAALGHNVIDTTCPLVHRAHNALRSLVASGYTPLVIGKPGHVEVLGLIGDFPEAQVIQNIKDVMDLNIIGNKIGVISQTTQQINHVNDLLVSIKQHFPNAELNNSNNTAQLAKKCRTLGCLAYHIQKPDDLKNEWFYGVNKVGLTAGTSTPDEDVNSVRVKLIEIAKN